MTSQQTLPSFAPFLSADLRKEIQPDEWIACTAAWTSLIDAHLALPNADFARLSLADESIPGFLTSFSGEVATQGPAILGPAAGVQLPLLRGVLALSSRLLLAPSKQGKAPPPAVKPLLSWEFLSDLCRVQSKRRTADLLASLPADRRAQLETASLTPLKKSLIRDLDAGLANPPAALRALETRLDRLNFLLARAPWAAAFFLAGSDFLDGLVACFRLMNPPLRRAIVATTYLCVTGLAAAVAEDGGGYGAVTDQLYALKAAAAAHRAGPLNVNDSLVAELVTSTPLLGQLERKLDAAAQEEKGKAPVGRANGVLKDLAAFRKPGVGLRQPQKRLAQKKADKGKGVALDLGMPSQKMHIHRMEQITQIQDLFPDLGSGFVAKLLDEYGEDQEQVVAHLLDDSLPEHLQTADRKEELASNTGHQPPAAPSHLAPRPTPPLRQALPTRHNVFDDDELDQLSLDTNKLHLGKQNQGRTADDMLRDKSTAPNKAAILSALATFDLDDDERDDTYDAEDVGGTVDAAGGAEDQGVIVYEEVLFKAWKVDPGLFERDNAVRRGAARTGLRAETGMTDEAIEGWAVMLARNPQQQRRLDARFSLFTGAQAELPSTAWRAGPEGSGTEDSDAGGSSRGRGRGRGRGGGGGRGRGRGGGDVAGPTGEAETEQARRRKEANKGSRANHNRRDQRARKMGRGFAG